VFFAGLLLVAASLPAYGQHATGEEQLLDAQVTARGIVFHVSSGGCTHKAHFGLERLGIKPLTVRLVRLRPDYCEAHLPKGIVVKFSFAEIGAGPTLTKIEQRRVVIVNPIMPH